MILMMVTLIFICDDDMDDNVAAMSDGIGSRSWNQCDRACVGNAIAFADGEQV